MANRKAQGAGSPARNEEGHVSKGELVSGVATEMWLELIAYPDREKPENRSLWLLVDGAWLKHDDPEYNVERSVQSAFCDCSDRLEVLVWYRRYYEDDSGANGSASSTDPREAVRNPCYGYRIEGLVVRSK